MRSTLILLLLLIVAGLSHAQDRLVSYQGYLTDGTGEPVSDGTYQMIFSLWNDSTGGEQLWGETNSSVYVSAGQFSVMLGSVTPLSEDVLAITPLFLQVQVGEDPAITPRTRLGSVPRAATASRIDGDIETGPGYANFKDSEGGTIATIGSEGKGLPGYLSMYNPDAGFEGQTLVRIASDCEGPGLELFSPGDVPPDPCIYMGVEPSPFKGSIKMFVPQPEPPARMVELGVEEDTESGEWEALFSMSASNDSGDDSQELFLMSTSPTDGFSAKMFQPQPEPPGQVIMEMSTNSSNGAGIYMFNPQPEPPGQVFMLETGFARDAQVTMELTDTDTDIQTKLDPGRVKVGNDASDTYAKGELMCGLDSTTFYIQGQGAAAPGQAIAMLASSTEAKMGIGTLTPSVALHVDGDICYTGTIGACSDARFKTDVDELDGALDQVEQLRGVNYRWKQDDYPDRAFDDAEHVGFIAQEVREVVPQVVQQHDDGTLSVDYGRLTPLLVEAIKELREENRILRQRVESLERR